MAPANASDHAARLNEPEDARDDITMVMASEASQSGFLEDKLPATSSATRESEREEKKKEDVELDDQTNFLPTKQVIIVFLGLSVGLACSFLDQTIVATALPRISSDLHSGRLSQWVATSYLLTSLAFTPLYGRWSDVFGRKVVILFALGVFFVFSFGCALARTMIQLIVFRAFQGIGGGAISTMVLIIVSDIVSLRERGKYQGILEGTIALSNGLGPILGGVFSQYTTWRWAFWINIPLGSLAIANAVWLVPTKSVKGDMKSKLLKVDYVGSVLTIVSSILILLALTWGGVTYSWSSAPALVPLVLGIVVMIVFIVWECKWAALPTIPVEIFAYKTVIGVYICTFMDAMTFFATLYYVPQFLQLVRGFSAIMSSVLMLPFLAFIPFVVFAAGQVISRTGIYRPMTIFGFTFWTVAQGLQTTVDQHSSVGKVIGILLFAGFSAGFTFQTTLIAAQAAVPRNLMAVVTGVRNFVRLFGSTISLAICASIINNSLRTAVEPFHISETNVSAIINDPTTVNDPSYGFSEQEREAIIDGYTKGFKGVWYLTIACTGIAFLSSVFLIQQHELNRPDDADLKRVGEERLKQKKGSDTEKDIEAQGPGA